MAPEGALLGHPAMEGPSSPFPDAWPMCRVLILVLTQMLGIPGTPQAQQHLPAYEQLGFLPGKKSSSRLPRGPFSTPHTLSPCPGDKDVQTNPDISLAGFVLHHILLWPEKLALPLAAAPSSAPPGRADNREQENTLFSRFPSPSCPGTQHSGGLWPVTRVPVPFVPRHCGTCCRGASTSLQEPHPGTPRS